MQLMRVRVDVATLWSAPDAPRPVDAPATAERPDIAGWLAALDEEPDHGRAGGGRAGLHGRVLTQLLAGEPAVLLTEDDPDADWVQVVAPWQPSSHDPRGYPGWVRRAHLIRDDTRAAGRVPEDQSWSLRDDASAQPVLAMARRHLGTGYLWGGLGPHGLDCSGLVHLVWRELGTIVPRDADDQYLGSSPLDPREAGPGDLYFFGRPGTPIHHVGIVVAPGRMIHAPAAGAVVVEERLAPDRRATLTHAGRLPLVGHARAAHGRP